MAADESNRPKQFGRKVGGEDDHERQGTVYGDGVDGPKKRSAAGWHDRFPRGRRTLAGVLNGPGLRGFSPGRPGCSRTRGNGWLLSPSPSARAGESGAGDVVAVTREPLRRF